VQYGYDPAGNRTFTRNLTPGLTDRGERYGYDNLNRLTVMDRGVLNVGGTVVAPVLEHPTLDSKQQWANLDRRGNWLDYRWARTDNGQSTTYLQARTANGVNEYETIDPDGPPAEGQPPNQAPVPLSYDAAGNLTLDPLARSAGGGPGATTQPCGAGVPPVVCGQWYKYDEENRVVRVRQYNGVLDPNDPNDPNGPVHGAFVYVDPDTMQDYTYMTDQMGNVTGLVDSATGEARRQVFDAFGVNIGGYITFRCAADHDWADQPWWSYSQCRTWDPLPPPDGPERPCPVPESSPPVVHQPQPIERMQTGSFNWRGGEGSITDRVTHDMEDTETWETRWSAYTRPSTGLTYMQNRYYEPDTGRFTQADPMPYGPEMMWGQNNRWVYCGNDPVNASDPTGLGPQLLFGLGFAIGFGVGAYLGFSWVVGRPTGVVGAAIAAFIAAMGVILREAATGKCFNLQSALLREVRLLWQNLGLSISMWPLVASAVAFRAFAVLAGWLFVGMVLGFLAGLGVGALGGLLYNAFAVADQARNARYREPVLQFALAGVQARLRANPHERGCTYALG